MKLWRIKKIVEFWGVDCLKRIQNEIDQVFLMIVALKMLHITKGNLQEAETDKVL